MATWLNNDGLLVVFGPEEVSPPAAGGEYMIDGDKHWTEVEIDLTKLAVGVDYVPARNLTIPKGAQIETLETIVLVPAASSGAGTLDVGFRLQSQGVYDPDGLIVDQTVANMNVVGEKITYINGSAQSGVLVGTVLANTGEITAQASTAVFQAGLIKVRIYWFIP